MYIDYTIRYDGNEYTHRILNDAIKVLYAAVIYTGIPPDKKITSMCVCVSVEESAFAKTY